MKAPVSSGNWCKLYWQKLYLQQEFVRKPFPGQAEPVILKGNNIAQLQEASFHEEKYFPVTSLKQLSSRELHSRGRGFVHSLYEYVFNYDSNAEHININKEKEQKAGRGKVWFSPVSVSSSPDSLSFQEVHRAVLGHYSLPICSQQLGSASSALLALLRDQYTQDRGQITRNQHGKETQYVEEQGKKRV